MVWPPVRTTSRALGGIVATLQQHRYDEAGCARRLSVPAMRHVVARVVAGEGESLLRAADPLGILIALFLFNRAVPHRLAARVFDTRALRALEEMRLVEIAAATVTSPVAVFPCRDLFIVTDALGEHGVANKVMPLGAESYDLAALATRRDATRALDLCTGSGVHALLASRRCRDAVGIDISPRAIAFSEFNAWFNRISNVTFRRGDLYGPVRRAPGYDLITANPPYNPELGSPAGQDYHSGGESGEEVLSRIVAGVPAFLSEAGHCHVITLLVHREGDTIPRRLRRWMGASASRFDVLVLSRPVAYRSAVLKGAAGLPPWARALHDSWKRQKISGFTFGLVNFQWIPAGRRPRYVERRLGDARGRFGRIRISAHGTGSIVIRKRPRP